MENRRSSPPYIFIVLAWLAFAAYVWFTADQLPARVATHFGVNGLPNGWQTQGGYVRFTLIFGALVPAFVLGMFLLIRYCNGWGLNIPHKEYWLAPERRGQTFAFIQRQGIRLALLMIAFFTGIHYTILAANAHQPANLPSTLLLWIVGPFLAVSLFWAVTFTRHFRKTA